jgi:hypothetical protein
VPLEVTAEMTVDGRHMVQSWSVPGVPARQSRYGDVWSTYPAFGTVLARLPSGEGLWIDVTFGPQVNDVAGETVKFSSSLFYFVDSVSNPRVLTDYYNTARPDNCPPNFRIRNCEIALTVKRLPDGPAIIGRDVGGGDGVNFGYGDRLRDTKLATVPPVFFLSLFGGMATAPGLKDDALFAPLIHDRDRPTAFRVDDAGMNRLAQLAGGYAAPRSNKVVHLRYLGGKRWSAPDVPGDPVLGQATTDVGYRTSLTPADVQCCGAPTEPLQPAALSAVSGEIEWRGTVLVYEPIPLRTPLHWDVLFDPRDDTILVLGMPHVKRVWQLPPADIDKQ